MASRTGKTKRRKAKDDIWWIFNLNRETNAVELDEWGHEHIPGFLGVVPRDELDELYPRGQPMEPGSSCVINLDFGDYERGGTHWVAMRVSSESPNVMYCDPFGLAPPEPVVLRANRDGRGLWWTDVQQQGNTEVNCGPRALAVLYTLADSAKKNKELEAYADLAQI